MERKSLAPSQGVSACLSQGLTLTHNLKKKNVLGIGGKGIIRKALFWDAKAFQMTEAKSLLPYNDGGEARGKTEKRRTVGTFHFILGWK